MALQASTGAPYECAMLIPTGHPRRRGLAPSGPLRRKVSTYWKCEGEIATERDVLLPNTQTGVFVLVSNIKYWVRTLASGPALRVRFKNVRLRI